MKNNQILLLAGAAGLVWYFGFGPGKQRFTNAIPAAGSQPLLPDIGLPSFLPPTSQAIPQNTAISSPGANSMTASGSNPYATVAQQSVLFNWANGFGAGDQAAFYANYPNFTAAEISGLMDLINTWTTGGAITTARTQFWDNWRLKYKIDIG